MTIDLTQIILAVITLLFSVLMRYVIPSATVASLTYGIPLRLKAVPPARTKRRTRRPCLQR